MNPEQVHDTKNSKDIFTNEILALSSLPSFTGIPMNGLSKDYKKNHLVEPPYGHLFHFYIYGLYRMDGL